MTTNEQTNCRGEGCDSPAKVRGHCIAHYYVLRRMIERSRGTENPITWQTLEDAGVVLASRSTGLRYHDFVANVLETITKQQDFTP